MRKPLPDPADKIDDAQRRYFKGSKGKAALKKYYVSKKGKARRSERKQVELFLRECSNWVKEHPDRTAEDFLNEVLNNGKV